MTAVIEGEVVDQGELRRAVRTPEVLPPDVDTKVLALRQLPSAELQVAAVTTMLNHSRTGLLAAITAQDLPLIVEWKKKASAIETIAKQVRLGKEMVLDAAEFVRRAERGLGVAIREGQERGEITSKTNGIAAGPRSDYERDGKTVHVDRLRDTESFSKPTDYATQSELSGQSSDGIYAMTDGVSDEQFEEVIAEARDEGNLSRANVARKAQAKAKEVVDEDDPLIDAEVEPAPGRPKAAPQSEWPFKNTPTEFLAEITGTLAASADNIRWIRPGAIDAEELNILVKQARDSWKRINKHLRNIHHGQA